MENIERIKNDSVFKQVLADSFGGCMYDVANRGKYDSKHLIELWESASSSEREAAGGIVKGAISFLKGN